MQSFTYEVHDADCNRYRHSAMYGDQAVEIYTVNVLHFDVGYHSLVFVKPVALNDIRVVQVCAYPRFSNKPVFIEIGRGFHELDNPYYLQRFVLNLIDARHTALGKRSDNGIVPDAVSLLGNIKVEYTGIVHSVMLRDWLSYFRCVG